VVSPRAARTAIAAKREEELEPNRTAPSRQSFVLQTSPVVLLDQDVLAQYDSLRKCCSSEDFGAQQNVLALTRFLQDHHCRVRIPAETNAGVVHTILLPWLEQLPLLPSTRSKQIGADLDVEILQTLQILLRDRKHASALLAPLTDNVSVTTGTERCTVNFVRRRLFAILQQRLFGRLQHDGGKPSPFPSCDEVSCECLTTALTVATEIDGKVNHKVRQLHDDTNHDLDTNAVLRFFDSVALTTSSCLPVLLLACLRHQPSLAPGLAKVLLLQDRLASSSATENSRGCCHNCGFVDEGSPEFLKMLHRSEKDSSKAVLMDCTSALLNGLPLHIWLQPSPSRPTASISNNTRQSANHFFRHRVVEALESLIKICLCCCQNNLVNASYLSLVKIVLTQIPYSTQDDSSLEQKLCQLVDRLARSSAATLPGDIRNKQAKTILIECMGGQTTPQGTRIPLCRPVAAWLVDAKGRSFLEKIMTANECSCENDDVLCATLRACPSVVLLDTTGIMWERLQNAVHFRCNHGNLSLQAARLIESFLRGRIDFPVIAPTIPARTLLDWILPLIKALILKSGNAAQKCSACAAYSCMQTSDWSCLAANEGRCHLTGVLSLCKDDVAKVRTQSFKTLGDICATVKPGSYYSCDNSILQSLHRAMEDSSSPVMALFCAANLAQSLDLLALLPEDLDICLFCRVAESSFALLDDSDQKVASNSSRATGYFCCIALREDFASRVEARKCDFLISKFLNQVLDSYVLCLQCLLALAQGNNAHQLSWKQRCRIKKQGRAACISLGLLFERGITKQTNATNAIVCLLDSVGQAKVLDEKFVSAACTALSLLGQTPLSQCLEMEGTILGRASNACCALVFQGANFRPGKDLIQAASLLLSHLMPCLKIADAKYMIVFYCAADRDDRMIQLYDWMVSNDCPPERFRSFVDAMQLTDVEIGVQVEQLFNQALAAATLLPNSTNCEEL